MKRFSLLLAAALFAACAAPSEDAASAASELSSDPHGSPARYPIVLAHGFLGVENGFADFDARISNALAADGHVVRRADVPPFGSVAIRSRALGAAIDGVLAETGAEKVNV